MFHLSSFNAIKQGMCLINWWASCVSVCVLYILNTPNRYGTSQKAPPYPKTVGRPPPAPKIELTRPLYLAWLVSLISES